MKKDIIAAVVGGDLRSAHLACALADRNRDNKVYGLFFDKGAKLSKHLCTDADARIALPQSDIVILPLPSLDSNGAVNTPLSDSRLTWESFLDFLKPRTIVLAGKVSKQMHQDAGRRGIDLEDYLSREEFAVLNAVPAVLPIEVKNPRCSRVC